MYFTLSATAEQNCLKKFFNFKIYQRYSINPN